jgi:trehalose/maltose hydrolase-like predicted phosphorylase
LRRTLDLRGRVLQIEAVYETPGGRRTAVRTRRCASLADRHLLLQEACVSPENHWAPITLEPSLDQPEPDLAMQHPHLERIEHLATPDLELVRYQTRASGFEICVAARVAREPMALRRIICVFTSRDGPDPRSAALASAAVRMEPVRRCLQRT